MSEGLGPQEGYLWAYRIDADGCIAHENMPLPDGAAPGQGWIWAHFALSDQRARTFIARRTFLPDPARDILLGDDCAPKIAFQSGWTYGAVPDFERDLHGGTSGPGRLRFAFNGETFITTRRHALEVIHALQHELKSGAFRPATPADAFIRICGAYCDMMEDQLDDLAVRANHIEDQLLGSRYDPEHLQLSPVRQELSRHQREIFALRTALNRAVGRAPEGTQIGAHFRVLMQRVEDVNLEVSALESRCRLIHEEIDTQINAQTNRTLRTLTILSTLLMPPTLIVGAFGMNLKGITFGDSASGFAIVCAVCLGVVLLTYALLRGSRVLR